MITNKGTLVRTRVSEVSVVGRNTQGVKLINVGKGELVVGLAVVDVQDDEELDYDENADAETTDIENSADSAEESTSSDE